MDNPQPNRYVMSVLVADRVGILRDITTAVTDLGANIDGVSQTVVAGFFTVILTAAFPAAATHEAVREAIQESFPPGEAAVVVRSHVPVGNASAVPDGDRYIVTLTGPDGPGILKTVTTFLAAKGANIEDWYVEFAGTDVTHIGEITVPARLDIKQLQDELRLSVEPLGLASALQHENIFIATNDVGGIDRLLRGRSNAAQQ